MGGKGRGVLSDFRMSRVSDTVPTVCVNTGMWDEVKLRIVTNGK